LSKKKLCLSQSPHTQHKSEIFRLPGTGFQSFFGPTAGRNWLFSGEPQTPK
jgi:hypothetical protein